MVHTRGQQLKAAMMPILIAWMTEYRKAQRFSQEKMAAGLGLSVRSYIDLEHGASFPSATTLALFLLLLSKQEQKALLDALWEAVEKGVILQSRVQQD